MSVNVPADPSPPFHLPFLSVIFFISGFCALIYQTVWIHDFSLIFGSTVVSTSVVVACFFSGIALGSYTFGRWSVSMSKPAAVYAVLEILLGTVALVLPVLMTAAQWIYRKSFIDLGVTGTGLFVAKIGIAFFLLIVPTSLMGGTLPILFKHFAENRRNIGNRSGTLYGMNTIGAACGCVVAGFILIRYFGMQAANVTACLLNVVAGCAAWLVCRSWQPSRCLSRAWAPGASHTVACTGRRPIRRPCWVGFNYSLAP